MILLLPLFRKHLEKAEFLAWKATIIMKAKEKRSCLKPNDICSLFFVTFERLTLTFRLLLKLSFTFRPIFGPTPTTSQSTYIDLQPPTVHFLRSPPHFQVLSESLSFTLLPTHTPLHY